MRRGLGWLTAIILAMALPAWAQPGNRLRIVAPGEDSRHRRGERHQAEGESRVNEVIETERSIEGQK